MGRRVQQQHVSAQLRTNLLNLRGVSCYKVKEGLIWKVYILRPIFSVTTLWNTGENCDIY